MNELYNVYKIISMLIASVFSYMLNKTWTFGNNDRNHKLYIWKYYVAFVINVAVNTLINTLIYNKTKQKLIALIIATGCATIVNFTLQKVWVFKKGENE